MGLSLQKWPLVKNENDQISLSPFMGTTPSFLYTYNNTSWSLQDNQKNNLNSDFKPEKDKLNFR